MHTIFSSLIQFVKMHRRRMILYEKQTVFVHFRVILLLYDVKVSLLLAPPPLTQFVCFVFLPLFMFKQFLFALWTVRWNICIMYIPVIIWKYPSVDRTDSLWIVKTEQFVTTIAMIDKIMKWNSHAKKRMGWQSHLAGAQEKLSASEYLET